MYKTVNVQNITNTLQYIYVIVHAHYCIGHYRVQKLSCNEIKIAKLFWRAQHFPSAVQKYYTVLYSTIINY